MSSARSARVIKRVRRELLVALKVVYPAALQADQLLRALLVLFPQLDFEQLKRDLHYLSAKGYVERVEADSDEDGLLAPWRRRWFRLTATGVELAEHCIRDPALED
jgi:hypothetical protein